MTTARGRGGAAWRLCSRIPASTSYQVPPSSAQILARDCASLCSSTTVLAQWLCIRPSRWHCISPAASCCRLRAVVAAHVSGTSFDASSSIICWERAIDFAWWREFSSFRYSILFCKHLLYAVMLRLRHVPICRCRCMCFTCKKRGWIQRAGYHSCTLVTHFTCIAFANFRVSLQTPRCCRSCGQSTPATRRGFCSFTTRCGSRLVLPARFSQFQHLFEPISESCSCGRVARRPVGCAAGTEASRTVHACMASVCLMERSCFDETFPYP